MGTIENDVAIVDRLQTLGEPFGTACRIVGISEKDYRETKGRKALKAFRMSRGLSCKEFAKTIGEPARNIPLYETGEKKTTERVLNKVRERYGVDVTSVSVDPRERLVVVIQSPGGDEITYDDLLAKVGEATRIYIRVDQNKAHWINGEETGSVDLWDLPG